MAVRRSSIGNVTVSGLASRHDDALHLVSALFRVASIAPRMPTLLGVFSQRSLVQLMPAECSPSAGRGSFAGCGEFYSSASGPNVPTPIAALGLSRFCGTPLVGLFAFPDGGSCLRR